MALEVSARAPQSAPRGRRVGVIDIGSNSVRLVVFDGFKRQSTPVFNERVLCGLGRRIGATGRLDEDGVARALTTLCRFARLVEAMGIDRLGVLATAAVREASDGEEFVVEVERQCGLRLEVLSGKEEARLSALGVISAAPGANGLMGDLGGGSLELVALADGQPGSQATLPLGQLRLLEMAGQGEEAVRAYIDEHLATLPWLGEAKGRALYAVGGGWRALARLNMAQTNYPLRVIHGYTLSRSAAAELAERVSGLSRRSLERIEGAPRRRLDALPNAALTMARVLETAHPDRLVFSAHGLREGWLYAQLGEKVRAKDPLIEACRELASREERFPEHGEELAAWTAPLFAGEGAQHKRLRVAACHLSELAWRVHSNHRADEAALTVLWAPLVGFDHAQRAFVALAVHARYTGGDDTPVSEQAAALADPKALKRALRLGLALRLGHTITGGASGLLGGFSLRLEEDELAISLSRRNEALLGESVRRRLDALARAYDRKAAIEVLD